MTSPNYWAGLYRWYAAGGSRDVAAYLSQLDISAFDAKAPPPKTAAFWEIVDASRAPENAELADALDQIYPKETVTIKQVAAAADTELAQWLRDKKNRRQIPRRMEECGYVAVRNDAAKDGLWKLDGRRQAIYAQPR